MEQIKEDKHPNSRIVTLRRNSNFLTKAQGEGIKDFLTSAIQGIGSYFEGNNSRRVASGMTVTEERIIMPEILGLHSEDKAYFEERNKYFANLETKVPENGTKLEIGMGTSNSGPLSKENLPLNLMDYIRYRHAKSHPWTASSQEGGKGNQLKHFYIDDPVVATSAASDVNALKDQAMTYYLGVKDNATKVEMALTLCDIDFRDIAGQTEAQTTQLRQEKLRKLVDEAPKKIVDMTNDKNFEVRYNINMMINTGVLKRVLSKILVAETGDTIGNLEETIEYFKDTDANSQTIGILKSKLQESIKANKKNKSVKEVMKRSN